MRRGTSRPPSTGRFRGEAENTAVAAAPPSAGHRPASVHPYGRGGPQDESIPLLPQQVRRDGAEPRVRVDPPAGDTPWIGRSVQLLVHLLDNRPRPARSSELERGQLHSSVRMGQPDEPAVVRLATAAAQLVRAQERQIEQPRLHLPVELVHLPVELVWGRRVWGRRPAGVQLHAPCGEGSAEGSDAGTHTHTSSGAPGTSTDPAATALPSSGVSTRLRSRTKEVSKSTGEAPRP